MTIADLIRLAQVRLTFLSQRRSMAEQVGDASAVETIDGEIAETEATMAKLRAIPE